MQYETGEVEPKRDKNIGGGRVWQIPTKKDSLVFSEIKQFHARVFHQTRFIERWLNPARALIISMAPPPPPNQKGTEKMYLFLGDGGHVSREGNRRLVTEEDLELALLHDELDEDLFPPSLDEVEYLLPEPGPGGPRRYCL